MLIFRLKELREDHDLTQQKLADLLKITRQNYSRWETSEKIIPLKHLNTLANFYDVSLDYIMGINNIKNAVLGFHLPQKIVSRKFCGNFFACSF